MNLNNPLTGLPGNSVIQLKLQEIVKNGTGKAAYVDIIDFKPFNDYYGFALGDSVIRRLGQILQESLPDFFVGHIGGDDFICTGYGDKFVNCIENARQRFRSITPGFYTQRDRELGGIETFDRQGSYKFLPLLDIAVVFTSGSEKHMSVESLSRKAGQTKKLLKGEQIAEPVFPVLQRAIQQEYPLESTKALIEATGVLREEGAVDVLDRILTGKFNWNLRKSAALALGYIGNARCIELLLYALNDSNPHVRTRSVEGLSVSMGYDSGELIIPMLSDKSTWVRRAVLSGIGYAGWKEGLTVLKSRATAIAPGPRINTTQERKAALEGISMLTPSEESGFLAELYNNKNYFPREEVYKTLCAVGTDIAAETVIHRNSFLPGVLNLIGVREKNLRKLESLAVNSLSKGNSIATGTLRFFEGFPLDFEQTTTSELKNNLGSFSGDLFRRLVILLDTKEISVDRSTIARVASRIDSGEQIGTSALSAFLSWVSHRGGVPSGSLLKSFIRSDRRAVAASAALAVRAIADRDLTRKKNVTTIS